MEWSNQHTGYVFPHWLNLPGNNLLGLEICFLGDTKSSKVGGQD